MILFLFYYFRWILEYLSYKVGIRIQTPVEAEQENNNQIPLNNEENSVPLIKLKPKQSEVKWQNNVLASEILHRHDNVLNGAHKRNRENVKLSDSELLLSKIDVLLDKLRLMEEEGTIKSDWRIVAMTIDRCLLILFAAMVFITLVGCFSISPGYVP